jgi:hypothetical protein
MVLRYSSQEGLSRGKDKGESLNISTRIIQTYIRG